jgi:hypothetical protein
MLQHIPGVRVEGDTEPHPFLYKIVNPHFKITITQCHAIYIKHEVNEIILGIPHLVSRYGHSK